jgi:hypothetical protein
MPKEITKAKKFTELLGGSKGKDKAKVVLIKRIKNITKFKYRGKYLYTFKTSEPSEINTIKGVHNVKFTDLDKLKDKKDKKAKK